MIKYEGPVGLEAAWVGKETIRVGGSARMACRVSVQPSSRACVSS